MENNNKDQQALDLLLDLAAEHEKRKSNENKYQLMVERARKRYRSLYLTYGSATIVMLFVVVTALVNPFQHTLSSLELFEQNYTRHHFDHEYRSENSDFDAFSKAVEEYESGNSGNCIQTLTPLVTENLDKTDYQLLMGLALIDSGQYQDALPWLKSVSDQGGTYEVVGLWYQGLAYLAIDQTELAVDHLEQISIHNNSEYSKRAKGVIKTLRN